MSEHEGPGGFDFDYSNVVDCPHCTPKELIGTCRRGHDIECPSLSREERLRLLETLKEIWSPREGSE